MPPHDPSKPSLVPENVLKKKANLDRLSLARQDRLSSAGNRKVYSAPSKTGVVKIRKAEKFVTSARGKLNNERRYKRVMKKGLQSKKRKQGATVERTVEVATGDVVSDHSDDDSDAEEAAAVAIAEGTTKKLTIPSNSLHSPVIFCVRIRPASASTPPLVKRTLSTFRLRNINEGVFLKNDSSVLSRLNACEHYVLYGPPDPTLVRELLNRRGHVKVAGEEGGKTERVPLSDNVIVERVLGDLGMICVEDIAAELLKPTAAFVKVGNFLWPFRLTSENSRFETEKLGGRTGKKGEYGDVGEEIGVFVRRML